MSEPGEPRRRARAHPSGRSRRHDERMADDEQRKLDKLHERGDDERPDAGERPDSPPAAERALSEQAAKREARA